MKWESRVVVANGRTGGDREVPKQPARKRCGLATANPDWGERIRTGKLFL